MPSIASVICHVCLKQGVYKVFTKTTAESNSSANRQNLLASSNKTILDLITHMKTHKPSEFEFARKNPDTKEMENPLSNPIDGTFNYKNKGLYIASFEQWKNKRWHH